jgi:hypothetical protein
VLASFSSSKNDTAACRQSTRNHHVPLIENNQKTSGCHPLADELSLTNDDSFVEMIDFATILRNAEEKGLVVGQEALERPTGRGV